MYLFHAHGHPSGRAWPGSGCRQGQCVSPSPQTKSGTGRSSCISRHSPHPSPHLPSISPTHGALILCLWTCVQNLSEWVKFSKTSGDREGTWPCRPSPEKARGSDAAKAAAAVRFKERGCSERFWPLPLTAVMGDVGGSGPVDLSLKMPKGKFCPRLVRLTKAGMTSLAEPGRGRTEASEAELFHDGPAVREEEPRSHPTRSKGCAGRAL